VSEPGGSVHAMRSPSPESQADPLRAQVDEVRARLFATLNADDARNSDTPDDEPRG
jgi:hypothetical protein